MLDTQREQNAEKWWPERKMNKNRKRHEYYDALHKISRALVFVEAKVVVDPSYMASLRSKSKIFFVSMTRQI